MVGERTARFLAAHVSRPVAQDPVLGIRQHFGGDDCNTFSIPTDEKNEFMELQR